MVVLLLLSVLAGGTARQRYVGYGRKMLLLGAVGQCQLERRTLTPDEDALLATPTTIHAINSQTSRCR